MPRIHPRTWDDGVMPLEEFPDCHLLEILDAIERSEPPPERLALSGGGRIQSRAWWEWHWARGLKLRHVPGDGRARRKIPAALRQQVYERDEHACLHCGTTEGLTLDHVHPFSLGGDDTLSNLQTLCHRCNSRKGARV